MYFEVDGFGERVVLFLHGWGGNTSSFSTFCKSLSARFRTINIDFKGFGKSEEPSKPWSVDDYANSVVELLNTLGVTKVSIVAHSFGGRVAIKMASKHPELIEKLVLVDSAGVKPKRGIRFFFAVKYYKFLKFLVKHKILKPKVLENRGSSDYSVLSETMKETFIKIVNEDLKSDIKNIKSETLIIWGERDTETPLFMAKKLSKWIANSGLIVLKNSSHFAYLENPYQFEKILKSFL